MRRIVTGQCDRESLPFAEFNQLFLAPGFGVGHEPW
jgi:hypothetical protein